MIILLGLSLAANIIGVVWLGIRFARNLYQKYKPCEYWWIEHVLDPGFKRIVQITRDKDGDYFTSCGNNIPGKIDQILRWIERVDVPR